MYILPRKGYLLFNKLLLPVPLQPRSEARLYVPYESNLNITYMPYNELIFHLDTGTILF